MLFLKFFLFFASIDLPFIYIAKILWKIFNSYISIFLIFFIKGFFIRIFFIRILSIRIRICLGIFFSLTIYLHSSKNTWGYDFLLVLKTELIKITDKKINWEPFLVFYYYENMFWFFSNFYLSTQKNVLKNQLLRRISTAITMKGNVYKKIRRVGG